MTHRFLLSGTLLLFALAVTACGASASQADLLTGKVWVLTQIDYPATGQTLKPPSGTLATLEFKNDNTVSGNGGCNTFGGGYELGSGNELKVKDLFSTLMACIDMEIETAYFEALGKANAYTIQNDQLQVTTSDGSAVLTFESQKP